MVAAAAAGGDAVHQSSCLRGCPPRSAAQDVMAREVEFLGARGKKMLSVWGGHQWMLIWVSTKPLGTDDVFVEGVAGRGMQWCSSKLTALTHDQDHRGLFSPFPSLPPSFACSNGSTRIRKTHGCGGSAWLQVIYFSVEKMNRFHCRARLHDLQRGYLHLAHFNTTTTAAEFGTVCVLHVPACAMARIDLTRRLCVEWFGTGVPKGPPFMIDDAC